MSGFLETGAIGKDRFELLNTLTHSQRRHTRATPRAHSRPPPLDSRHADEDESSMSFTMRDDRRREAFHMHATRAADGSGLWTTRNLLLTRLQLKLLGKHSLR
jgi:hypothetical protein